MFNAQVVKETFPKGIGVKTASEYKDVLKEKKRKKPSEKPKVQAESLQMKMKDILNTTIKDMGNPVSFHINQTIV